MRMARTLAAAGAALLVTASGALAAPCGPGQQQRAADARSSTIDPPATATVTPGARAESPGAVGAYQNLDAAAGTSSTARQPQANAQSNNAQPGQQAAGGDRC